MTHFEEWHGSTTPAQSSEPIATAWELYQRILPVAICYGSGRRLFVSEFQHAGRLLKEFHRIGRKRMRIRGVISTAGYLDPLTLAALNCYLQHRFSRQSIRQLRAGQLQRFAWYNLQEQVPLRWHR